jgi:hypothetical protein
MKLFIAQGLSAARRAWRPLPSPLFYALGMLKS